MIQICRFKSAIWRRSTHCHRNLISLCHLEKYSYTAALVLAKQYISTLQYCSLYPNEKLLPLVPAWRPHWHHAVHLIWRIYSPCFPVTDLHPLLLLPPSPQQLLREMQQMASRPFATINVALEMDEEPPDLIGGNVKVSTTFFFLCEWSAANPRDLPRCPACQDGKRGEATIHHRGRRSSLPQVGV